MLEKKTFIDRIKLLNTDDEYKLLAQEIIAEAIPWFFQNEFNELSITKYTEFKMYMSQKFDISPQDVSLGGSAWLGFSLSPQKDYRDFNEKSDIDIVIISNKVFNSLWDCYLKQFIKGGLYGEVYKKISKNTFKRFVDYKDDSCLSISEPYYIKFQKKTNGYVKDLQIFFNFPEKIGYRIYKSWDDYNLNVIKTLKDLNKKATEVTTSGSH